MVMMEGSPASGVVIEEDLVGEAVSIPPPHAGVHLKLGFVSLLLLLS